MSFFKAFGYTAGAVLGTYVGVRAVIEIESLINKAKRAKKEQEKQAQQEQEKAQQKQKPEQNQEAATPDRSASSGSEA
jgi:sortase (surface protein transpeptidase)